MAKRGHWMELGCIVCDALTDIGAGKEGWLLETSDILCVLDYEFLAFANGSIVLVIGWSAVDSGASSVKIMPQLSTVGSETITAIEWIVYDEIRVIAVGTSLGWFMVYTVGGDLVHRQMIHPAQILNLKVRNVKSHAMQDCASELCLAMPGIIARIDGSSIQVVLQRWFQERNIDVGNKKCKSIDVEGFGVSVGQLTYKIWNISKYGPSVDAAITGIMPPPLMEFEEKNTKKMIELVKEKDGLYFFEEPNGYNQTPSSLLSSSQPETSRYQIWLHHKRPAAFVLRQSSQHYYCAISIGDDAVISAFRLSEDRNRSLVGAILSKVVPVTFSAISSVSKLFWRKESSQKSEAAPQAYAQASALTCLKDSPRKGKTLTVLPNGTLAAVTDSLGRVLLLDTQALVVIRLWKGYRNATCLFVEMQCETSDAQNDLGKGASCLCLAIHAPKKGIVEVWQMRTGPRLLTVQCPRGSKILQPPSRFLSSESSSPSPLQVFLLNGDSGQISLLSRSI